MRTTILLLSVLHALPAAAVVPGELDYQGLLLDSAGTPVNGVVDLDFEIFDAPSAGSSLWFESHVDVPVVDGVYDVTLGQTTPLTPELLAGGSLHLEIAVEGETLSPRERIVAVPYALRAARAESVEAVGGIDPAFVAQIFQHVSYDGGEPPNDDPREGLADVDGDGLANFIDPDNDGDGLSDVEEVNGGTDINLVTPRIDSLTPAEARGSQTTSVLVQGASFESGFTVDLDGSPLTPSNVTPTSFEVTLGPASPGEVNLTVANPGGEFDSAPFYFSRARAFVSSLQISHGSAGLTAYDDFCQRRADAAGLGGTWLVWLSDSSTSPSARFVNDGQGWERVDRVKIADDLADLTDGSLDDLLWLDENGVVQSFVPDIYTGTLADGTASGVDCADWSSTTGSATAGTSDVSDDGWTDNGVRSCSADSRLYCFEQN